MAFIALPPYALRCAAKHHRWRERPVLARMPLCCKRWICCREVVEAGEHSLVSTIRAPIAIHPAVYGRFPFVTKAATPPHLLPRSRAEIHWGEGRVQGRMPFCRYFGVRSGQVVLSCDGDPSRTIRASSSAKTRIDPRLPFVAFATSPPRNLRGARRYIAWTDAFVLRWVPLGCKFGVPRSQVIEPLEHLSVRAKRAAPAFTSALDFGFPLVALIANPPDLPMGTSRYIGWR